VIKLIRGERFAAFLDEMHAYTGGASRGRIASPLGGPSEGYIACEGEELVVVEDEESIPR
jgi:hypothetical protein